MRVGGWVERGLEKRGERVCVECWVHIYIHNCRTTFIEIYTI